MRPTVQLHVLFLRVQKTVCVDYMYGGDVQMMTLDEGSRSSTDAADRAQWTLVMQQLCHGAVDDRVTDWIEPKPHRVLLLAKEHLVYLRWCGPGNRANRVRWVLHLEHIASISTVAHTLVITHNTPIRVGTLPVELPRRHCLASAQDTMADLLLHKVNCALDSYFKHKLMQGKLAAASREPGTDLTDTAV